MTRLTARYDGKFIIPDEPVDLPRDRSLVIHVDDSSPARDAQFGTLEFVHANLSGYISDADAAMMRAEIDDAFEKVSPEPDVNLD